MGMIIPKVLNRITERCNSHFHLNGKQFCGYIRAGYTILFPPPEWPVGGQKNYSIGGRVGRKQVLVTELHFSPIALCIAVKQ